MPEQQRPYRPARPAPRPTARAQWSVTTPDDAPDSEPVTEDEKPYVPIYIPDVVMLRGIGSCWDGPV